MSATATASRLHSDEYEALMTFWRHLAAPYTEHDVRAFNALYRDIYPRLSRAEKRLAERLVDRMIDGLQSRELAPLIYGVV